MLFGWFVFALLCIPHLVGASPSLSTEVVYPSLPAYLQMAANPLIWLFVAGVVIGLIYQSPLRLPAFWARWLVFFACTCWAFQYAAAFRFEHGIFEGGASAMLLLLALTLGSKSIDIKAPRPLVELGNMSFSLYLLHPLVQERTEAVFKALELADYAKGFPFLFLTTTLSILLAMLSRRWLELGASNWIKRHLLARRRPASEVSVEPLVATSARMDPSTR